MRKMNVKIVWFDSMGAKSSCIFVETPDVKVLVDPGAAELQPKFPLPDELKAYFNRRAHEEIERAASNADIVIITHYHYDHHTLPSNSMVNADVLYGGKLILAKNPNVYINGSQWDRARLFFREIFERFGDRSLKDEMIEPEEMEFPDPMESLPLASSRDYGDYSARKRELLEKGRKWFQKLCETWKSEKWVPEVKFQNLEVKFADGKEFRFGDTIIRFSNPMFHGMEFDRLGWVLAVVIEHAGEKLLYTSDLQGPVIEDYAAWIIDERPDLLIVDGPPTYLFGYMLNRINLGRAVENMCRIIRESNAELIIYDHHLLRDAKYRERVGEVYEVARKEEKKVLTAAELLGEEPIADRALKWKEDEESLKRYMHEIGLSSDNDKTRQ